MSLPIPDIKQISGFRKYMVEYVIIVLAVCVAVLFGMVMSLNKEVRENFMLKLFEANKIMEKAANTTDDFLRYQRFERPMRNNEIDAPRQIPDTVTMDNRR